MLKKNYHQIYIVVPGTATTGGPESLFLLSQELNKLGKESKITLYPYSLGKNHDTKIAAYYSDYDISYAKFKDKKNNLIIFPEILANEALKIKFADAAIWWLSVDNFLERRYDNQLKNSLRYLAKCITGERPWLGIQALRKIIHFSKSFYDDQFLKLNGINPIILSGPINDYFIINQGKFHQTRENIVLYNPVKSQGIINKLSTINKNIIFKPLNGMSREELLKNYSKSKIYIDFGHHPGKERMPREAAICGCCIITGTKGSANNDVDIPIPRKYKIDEGGLNYLNNIHILINNIFERYDENIKEFDIYRQAIKNEKNLFREQLKANFIDMT